MELYFTNVRTHKMKWQQLINIAFIRLGVCALIIFFYLLISSYDLSGEGPFSATGNYFQNNFAPSASGQAIEIEDSSLPLSFVDQYLQQNNIPLQSWHAYILKTIIRISQAFVAWDSVYFVELTHSSVVYRQENVHAFFPGFPLVAYFLRKILFDWWLNDVWLYIASVWCCVLVSNISFIAASFVLYHLTIKVYESAFQEKSLDPSLLNENIDVPEKKASAVDLPNPQLRERFKNVNTNQTVKQNRNENWNQKTFSLESFASLVSYIFALTPASVFCSSPYTEPLFSLLSFSGMYFWVTSKGNSLLAAAFFGAGSFVRGNGIILAGFFIYGVWKVRSSKLLFLPQILLTILPYIAVQYLGFMYYCNESWNENLMDAIQTGISRTEYLKEHHPWCLKTVPHLYPHVQSKYWNVGFFKYWTVSQIPNFLLAFPITFISLYGIYKFAQGRVCSFLFVLDLKKTMHRVRGTIYQIMFQKAIVSSVFMYYHLFLVLYTLIGAHSQILTRFLVASPAIHWITAYLYLDKSWKNRLMLYHVLYIFSGCILHPNFFPWT